MKVSGFRFQTGMLSIARAEADLVVVDVCES